MKKTLRIIFTIVFMLAAGAGVVSAQGIQNARVLLEPVAKEAGVTETNLGNIVGTTINAILSLVGLIFLGMMVYAGMLIMTAHGEEEQIKKGQKIIVASIIGLVITVGAYAITYFVTAKFEGKF